MRVFVAGASRTVRALALVPEYARHLGHLYVPGGGNRVSMTTETRLPFGVDNGAFTGFDEQRFVDLVKRALPYGPEWVVMPDFVGNARGTLLSFDWWLSWWNVHGVDLADVDVPLAVVGQDGLEECDWDHWFGYARCFFVGGTTEWKLSNSAADLAREAKRRGLWVHMGRVNSRRRLLHALALGCDSVDGSGYSRYADTRLPAALDLLVRMDGRSVPRQLALPFAEGAL